MTRIFQIYWTALLLTAALFWSGCATILMEGSKQGVLLHSQPEGADIYFESTKVGQTPAYVLLPRQSKARIEFKDSDQNIIGETTVETEYRWGISFFRNFIFLYGAPIGWGVDLITGDAWKYKNPPATTLTMVATTPDKSKNPTRKMSALAAFGRKMTVAIAPPVAPTFEMSDRIAHFVEGHLYAENAEYEIVPYSSTLKRFLRRDYDFNHKPDEEELHTLYAELQVDYIFHSELHETEDGRQLVRGRAVHLIRGDTDWSREYALNIDPIKGEKVLPWYRLTKGPMQFVPNTPFIEFGSRALSLDVNGEHVAAHGAPDVTIAEQLGEWIGSLGLTRLTPPRGERRAYLRFQWVPSVRLAYSRIHFPDLPEVRKSEFKYLQLGGGIGPEGGLQIGSHYLYLNFIPLLSYNYLGWSKGDKQRETQMGSFTLRTEAGYNYFLTQRWSFRLFTRSTTVDAQSFAKAFNEITPQVYNVKTAADLSSGFSFGYTFDPSLDIY